MHAYKIIRIYVHTQTVTPAPPFQLSKHTYASV